MTFFQFVDKNPGWTFLFLVVIGWTIVSSLYYLRN